MAMFFRAAVPFICLQALGLALCIVFPAIILWLPRLVYAASGG
jgi:TRAP-type mannitol/chloroaromatic compound transport system permease large subunit